MTDRMSVAEYRGLKSGRARVKGAKTVIVNGWRFQSRLEADRYVHWRNLWQLGVIAWFTRQMPFYLPGSIIYRLDFFIVGGVSAACPPLKYEDCKGHLTDVSRNKIKQVEDIYKIKIDIITREDMR